MSKITINSFLSTILILINYFIWLIFFTYLWSTALVVENQTWYANNIAHWADGAAHLSYMSAFAERDKFPLDHPLYVNHSFSYSFAIDAIGGLLARIMPLWFAYNLVGLVATLVALLVLHRLVYLITHSHTVSVISLNLFLLSGGLGIRYILPEIRTNGLIPTLTQLPHLYTQIESKGLVWLNIIVGEFLPQRAMLLGFIVGGYILHLWIRHFIQNQPQKPLKLFISGILYPSLFIIHPHTLIVLTIFLMIVVTYRFLHRSSHTFLSSVIYFLFKPFSFINSKYRTHQSYSWLLILIPAIFIGSFLYFTFIYSSVKTNFFRFQLGWMSPSKNRSFISFWVDNWGLVLPLGITSYLFLKTNLQKLIYGFAWFLFILSNIVLYQPYDWDNAKIFTWSYLFFAICIGIMLQSLWTQTITHKTIAFCLYITLTISGFVDLIYTLERSTPQFRIPLIQADDVILAERFKKISPPESIVLTSSLHDNWVPLLTGRQILLGYQGWIWTYGINYSQRVQDMKHMFQGDGLALDLIQKYHIDYVVIGPKENYEFKANQFFFDQHFPLVLQDNRTYIYQTQPSPSL